MHVCACTRMLDLDYFLNLILIDCSYRTKDCSQTFTHYPHASTNPKHGIHLHEGSNMYNLFK